MAVIAVAAAGNMGRMLAGRNDAIVARPTCTQDLSVVNDCDGFKSDGAVAVLANVSGLHVDQTLARSSHAVVTRNAISDNSHVVEDSGQPGGR